MPKKRIKKIVQVGGKPPYCPFRHADCIRDGESYAKQPCAFWIAQERRCALVLAAHYLSALLYQSRAQEPPQAREQPKENYIPDTPDIKPA